VTGSTVRGLFIAFTCQPRECDVMMLCCLSVASSLKAQHDYGWLIGLLCAVVIVLLIILLIVCLARRAVGHRYSGTFTGQFANCRQSV